eukprot:5820491-Pyramimonas_sp.AAC.1
MHINWQIRAVTGTGGPVKNEVISLLHILECAGSKREARLTIYPWTSCGHTSRCTKSADTRSSMPYCTTEH